MKYGFYLILLIFPLIFPWFSFSLVILKTKDRQAFIHLQGINVKKGSYFSVYDLNGDKKGLVQIDKVSQTKAIGTLKTGSMSRKWSLQFVPKKVAFREMQKASEKKKKIALIRKEKLKRRLAQQKQLAQKKRLAQQRRLAQQKRLQLARKKAQQRRLAQARQKQRQLTRKKANQRRLASFQLEEDILGDLNSVSDSSNFEIPSQTDILPEDQQSEEILSYREKEEEVVESPPPAIEPPVSTPSSSKGFVIGLNTGVQYHYMHITPKKSPLHILRGIGYEPGLQAFVSLNDFIDVGALLGYRHFYGSGTKDCPRDQGCSLRIHYISGALNIKWKYFQFQSHKLWLDFKGTLLMPLAYSNKVNLTKESFGPLHGTLGGGLGIDLKFGKWLIPISVSANLYMPPTETVKAYTAEARAGLLYQF